jgi:hypothetical protein
MVVLNSRGFLSDPEQRRGVLQGVAVSRQRDALVDASAVEPAAPPPGDLLAAAVGPSDSTAWRLVPVGYRVSDFTADAATVDVWTVQVMAGVGAVNVPASALWATTTLRLEWEGHGWLLDVGATRTSLGPTPGLGPAPQSSDLDVISADLQFEEYGHVAR